MKNNLKHNKNASYNVKKVKRMILAIFFIVGHALDSMMLIRI